MVRKLYRRTKPQPLGSVGPGSSRLDVGVFLRWPPIPVPAQWRARWSPAQKGAEKARANMATDLLSLEIRCLEAPDYAGTRLPSGRPASVNRVGRDSTGGTTEPVQWRNTNEVWRDVAQQHWRLVQYHSSHSGLVG